MDKTHSRREFMRLSAVAAAMAAAPDLACGKKGPTTAPCAPCPNPPSLGGAPDTHEGHTVAAFVDTVIPSCCRDPVGTPGGLDVNAPALFFDPELPTTAYIPALVLLLDGVAYDTYGTTFEQLTYDQRDRALATGLTQQPLLELAVILAKLAFYSSDGAGLSLGYQGANNGYISEPDYTFGRPMSKELTTDGNLP